MMADFNQNFVTNNVTVESDEVIKFINPFENLQQHQLEDFSLFLSVDKKCRCCFSKLINESEQNTVESWHRQAFLAMTGVEMITPDSENFLCQKCAEILKIYTELGKSAANLQKKYNILIEDLASDIKTETDEISSRLQDYNLHSDIVKSDYEIISYDHEQLQQTNIIQNEIIRDKEISIEETIENSARVKNCTVRLTRIDSETIDKYEYYSIVGSREEQMIDKTSTTSAKLKTTSQKYSVANTLLKIMNKTANNTKCHICGFSSKSLNGLKTHIRDHHIKPRLSCDFCVKSFFSKQNLLQHMQTYHMNIKFSCHLCSAEFDSSAKLRDHKGIVHYKHLKCEECDAAFGKPCLLLGHIKAMHGGKRWYCHYQKCSSSFSLRFYAKQHFQKVHSLQSGETMKKYLKTVKNNKRKTKCQICGMTVKTQEALYEHFRKTHANTMRYSCDLCGKTFSHLQKMVLIDHMYKHQVKVKFSCSLCPAEFPSNYKLILHEKNSHNKKFKCEKCGSSFKEPKDLKEHVKVQHEGKRYKCQYPGCSKIYFLIGSLRKHLYDTHKLKGEEFRKYSPRLNQGVESKIEDDDDDAKCEICRKIFKSRSVLHGHIRLVHKKNKSCDICGKTFANKVLLINHMQTYHMKLQFECDLCPLEFRSESKLKTHKRFAHYRNFKCEKCNLAFGNLYLLKNHVKVKHEGKRYHCSFPGCSASFTTRGITAKHLVAAHSLMGENFNRFNEKLSLQ